ncbi:hypothetical protein KL86DES1_21016 [uncultured Desulfovibrio sp.]|uniref:Uncharacterized protein n=1 Tax=uncultured Desulfovibrio sp. TaxID=167968 RepID=A0A212L6B7_9BACT|nr:hypothetical protein KL86DES1_21016 [uncultured Desulfovibrio sp.]VZH33916.1 conserved protein of unknown function [Desulfovibrio sp. 86]
MSEHSPHLAGGCLVRIVSACGGVGCGPPVGPGMDCFVRKYPRRLPSGDICVRAEARPQPCPA